MSQHSHDSITYQKHVKYFLKKKINQQIRIKKQQHENTKAFGQQYNVHVFAYTFVHRVDGSQDRTVFFWRIIPKL